MRFFKDLYLSKSFLSKVSVAVFSKNPGIPGNLTPFTLSNQKQAGQLMKASIRERLNSYGSGLLGSYTPLCLAIDYSLTNVIKKTIKVYLKKQIRHILSLLRPIILL